MRERSRNKTDVFDGKDNPVYRKRCSVNFGIINQFNPTEIYE